MLKIRSELLYFILYILASPFREFFKLYKRTRDVLNPPATLWHKLNYPKAWMWLFIIWFVFNYLVFKRLEKFLFLGVIFAWVWGQWESGHWKHEYRSQFSETS